MHVAGGYCCWVVDMALLTALYWRSAALEAERGGGGGSADSGRCPAPTSSTWVEALAPALATVLASGALAAVVDAAWRLHFLRRHQTRPGSELRREAARRQQEVAQQQ